MVVLSPEIGVKGYATNRLPFEIQTEYFNTLLMKNAIRRHAKSESELLKQATERLLEAVKRKLSKKQARVDHGGSQKANRKV